MVEYQDFSTLFIYLFFVIVGGGWDGDTIDCAYLVFIQTLLPLLIRSTLFLSINAC